jgi:DNA-binding transcriptional LysR family regulator
MAEVLAGQDMLSDWPERGDLIRPRAVVRAAAPLFHAVCARLGDAADRAVLIAGLGYCLAQGGGAVTIPGDARDRVRRGLARMAQDATDRILEWVAADAASPKDRAPQVGALAFESLCTGHRWPDDVVEQLALPGGGRVAMQLYNEWIHQLVILRDLALAFDDWADRPLPFGGPGPQRGLRRFDAARRQFREEIASHLPPERSLAQYRAATEALASGEAALDPPGGGLAPTRMLDNELLRVFLAVVRCGSFTGAAQALNRTQAAVSMQIRRLEEIVQARLIQRENRQFQLTAEGVTLCEYARALTELNDAALVALAAHRAAGPVRLAISAICAAALLPRLTRQLHDHFPECWLEVRTIAAASLDARAGHGDDDLVIDIVPRDTPGTTSLGEVPLRWFAAVRGNAAQRTPVPVALPPRDGALGRRAIQALDEAGLRWEPWLVSDSLAAIDAAIRSGEAIGVLPVIGDAPSDPAIRALGPGDGFPALAPMDLALATPGARIGPAAQKLRDLLVAG